MWNAQLFSTLRSTCGWDSKETIQQKRMKALQPSAFIWFHDFRTLVEHFAFQQNKANRGAMQNLFSSRGRSIVCSIKAMYAVNIKLHTRFINRKFGSRNKNNDIKRINSRDAFWSYDFNIYDVQRYQPAGDVVLCEITTKEILTILVQGFKPITILRSSEYLRSTVICSSKLKCSRGMAYEENTLAISLLNFSVIVYCKASPTHMQTYWRP